MKWPIVSAQAKEKKRRTETRKGKYVTSYHHACGNKNKKINIIKSRFNVTRFSASSAEFSDAGPEEGRERRCRRLKVRALMTELTAYIQKLPRTDSI